MTDQRAIALVAECQREAETCLYTGVTLHIWLRSKRRMERALLLLPIIFGAVATWSAIDATVPYSKWITGVSALLAGTLPAIYEALKLDVHLGQIASAAAEYTNLRDRFRQLAMLGPTGSTASFQDAFERLMERLDDVRKAGLTPPERFFKHAQQKIAGGHYSYSSDEHPSG